MVDADGVAIAVNDTVYLEGTVVAVNPLDAHFREVTVRLADVVPGIPQNDELTTPTHMTQIEGGNSHQPGAVVIIKCSNLMLTH